MVRDIQEFAGRSTIYERRTWNMTVDIPADLQSFLDEPLRLGGYVSPEQVMIDALRLLKAERDETLEDIRRGLADAAAGRMQPLAEAFADIRAGLGDANGS
jgi:Arc/MetJ-type ribon-helix-helix transcriptional regulator